ncbi:MAG: hypothetical protein OXI43_11540 [Candidatus Poribacteria bacterium]|nr:hypothetical protein [Candidatus Poribacteria bacterium]
MKMLKRQSLGIAFAMLLSLCFVINSGEAAEITSFYVYASTDYGGGADFWASLSADADIYFVSFYVKQTYPKPEPNENRDWIHAYSNMYASGTRSVYENIGSFDGHIKIAEYSVKAEVWFYDADGNPTNVSDTSTTTTSVYKPLFDPSGYQRSGVYGYSELTAHYFDGSSIVMDGYVWAYNGTDDTVAGSGRFRHDATNKALDELEEDLPPGRFKTGETYGYSTSDWGTYFNFDTRGPLGKNDEWVCEAYLRLNVHEDTWVAATSNTFNYKDNR